MDCHRVTCPSLGAGSKGRGRTGAVAVPGRGIGTVHENAREPAWSLCSGAVGAAESKRPGEEAALDQGHKQK